MIRTCTDCECEFSKKTIKKGKITQCDDCSAHLDDEKFLGYNDGALNKMSSIAIYRGTDKDSRKKIANQKNIVC